MNPEIEGTQTAWNKYEVVARPEHGRPVTLHVVPVKLPRLGERYFVSRDPNALGFITRHTTFEAAAKSANARAKRYVRAYSKPHGLAA